MTAEPVAFLNGELVLLDQSEDGEGLAHAIIDGESGGDDGLLGGGEEYGVDGGGAVFHFDEGFSVLADVEEGEDVGDARSWIAGDFGVAGEFIDVDLEVEEEAEVVSSAGDAFVASEGGSGGSDFVESADDDGIA